MFFLRFRGSANDMIEIRLVQLAWRVKTKQEKKKKNTSSRTKPQNTSGFVEIRLNVKMRYCRGRLQSDDPRVVR